MRPAGRIGRGFTLVEMIVTLVVMAVLAATLTLFYKPVIEGYIGVRTRTALTAEADDAMRKMLRDIRVAVPNSIRTPATNCFELVPAYTGGRYRMGTDTVNAGSAMVDPAGTTTSFDVFNTFTTTPSVGDWVVVDNQNPGDVYNGTNRSAITAVSTPSAALGKARLAINALQFPLGYDGGRFDVVSNGTQAVFYVCSGASTTLDASGNAPGVLYRLKAYGFNGTAPVACPATAGADVVATQVRSCRFLYTANQGATQQSGFISLQLELTRNSETTSLIVGAHVVNQP